jgi:hypothetical protein
MIHRSWSRSRLLQIDASLWTWNDDLEIDVIKSLNELPSVKAYLGRIGAEVRSLRTAVIQERKGQYWDDIAIIRFAKDGKVSAPNAFLPTESEQALILDQFSRAVFPELKLCATVRNLPPMISEAEKEDIFEFRNEQNEIIMLQVRKERKGDKSYIPWTYWTDDQWRPIEPEGDLPLWGVDQLKDCEVVFIHEGAKSARHCRRLVEANAPAMKKALAEHPWGEELKHAAHIGWIGGALSPHRTDWKLLQRAGVKRVYIVSDNDPEGVKAVPHISFALRCGTFHIQFTSEWPRSFDLADDFPESMFKTIGGERYYVGPSFRSCLHPATWATDQIPNPKGKPTTILRDSFKEMWAYAEEQDIYVCTEMPDIVRSEVVLNKIISSFSHVNNTTAILQRNYRGRSTRLCYRPDVSGRIVTEKNSSAINLHTPSHVKRKAGDPQPFLDFMAYLFPNAVEREQMADWCATLISHPAIKMDFGVLLVSESQGVGKTTLGSSILAPLVGLQNVSHPSEQMITNSEFNEWLAGKRLIVVNEIYSGHSWKAYNKLKSIITDKTVDVNKKYQSMFTIDNWSHMFACSNSMRALKMESDDRRWFYPEVTEMPWKREQFARFHEWLMGGGLSIIKHWAETRPTYVKVGQRAPMTDRKKELIEGSRTEAQIAAVELADALNSMDRPVSVGMKEIVAWVRQSVQGKVFDSDLELRKAIKEAGCIVAPMRIKLNGMIQYMILNKHRHWIETLANGVVPGKEDDDSWSVEAEIRAKTVKPGELSQEAI